MKMIFAIAAGGAVGAVARHFAAHFVASLAGHGFPWGILAVNILGSLIMGILVESLALMWSPSVELRAFMVVGILGSFTTFSTFALDTVTLMSRGQTIIAAAYIGVSVVVAVMALMAGMASVRFLVS
ncbi:fluoride efflux transporter CrcB [Aestuariispira ectoiniformans]|uniref:fluoride efflux transporter CrcB n=1 Tax=Aestuariispira ectoiniformans TaxID=2775080 RepID=UPI00223A7217|nr:fluoride efflux transporter CrcB [Aestuariispira ectoiniformans]